LHGADENFTRLVGVGSEVDNRQINGEVVDTDRDSNGRWLPGHAKTGGRKSRQYEENFRTILLEEISPEKFRSLIRVAYKRGMKGDYSFLKLLFDHMIGPPVERKEITGADNSPLVIRVIYDDERESD
jgi:hypothetical protein